jgi:hypothetical protein
MKDSALALLKKKKKPTEAQRVLPPELKVSWALSHAS